jgi:C-terminal processing protease CtpA/Prc
MRKRTLRKNAGFESVRRLRGNVGYLELSKFFRPGPVAPRLTAALQLLTDTAALIIDLRDCDGGDPDTVMLVASAFFDSRTHLNDVYWRDENRTEERWTTPRDAGTGYGEGRRILLLVGEDTASGCEDFAYALKNAGRATVFGEKTAGAAHAGSPQRLDAHFVLFVPSGRPISPVTGTDWEHVGVVPDVKVSARKALEAAHVELMKGLIAVEQDLEWKGKLEHMLADLE